MDTSTTVIEFPNLLQDSEFLQDFEKFAAEEYSVENVLAWKAIREYNRLALSNDPMLESKAREIYDLFINGYARHQVNLDEGTVQTIVESIEKSKFPPGLFDRMEKYIVDLMYKDTYKRFSRTMRIKGQV